jgi:hypothetical protein
MDSALIEWIKTENDGIDVLFSVKDGSGAQLHHPTFLNLNGL